MPRTILHADMDAFYAAIEQRDDPRLRGQPVIVGGRGPRSVVLTASYEARKFGVRSAMPGVIARRKCPQGLFVPPRMEVYAGVAKQVHAVFARYTPAIEPLSLDEAFLDVSGCEGLFGDGERIARRIKDDVRAQTGLTVSVGVAACKFVAKVASDLRKPDGLVVVPPGTEVAFLAPLPVRALWGVGPKTQAMLAELGLQTVADVQALSLEACVRLFGEAMGGHFFALARGDDPRDVESDRVPKSIGHEETFVRDVVARGAVHALLLRFAEVVGAQLRSSGLLARVVRIKLRAPDFTTCTRQQKLGVATDQDLDLHAAAVRLFDAACPAERPLRLLGLTGAELMPAGAARQRGLFEKGGSRTERAQHAFDRIRERFGEGAIRHGGVRET